jgi:predicted alpha/beta hydrolase family esterase
MKQLLCIHGWDGSPDSAWKPWLKRTAEELGYKTHFPQMPGGKHPKKKEWVKMIREIVKEPDASWTLVGHSLGCPAIFRFLEALPQGQEVGTVILIAGLCRHRKEEFEEIRPFFEPAFDWQKVRSAARHFVVVHSKDDTWVPLENGLEMAKFLRVDPIILDGFKHFSTDDNILEIPVLLQHL